jgi:hypothetical protein
MSFVRTAETPFLSSKRSVIHGTPLAEGPLGMKRALRNTDTTMFIKSDGGETKSFEMARSFASYDEAVAFCKGKCLTSVELVVHMDDNSQLTVPVQRRHLSY